MGCPFAVELESVDFKSQAERIDGRTSSAIAALAATGVRPRLVDIIASDDAGVASYARTKQRKATKLGVDYQLLAIDASQSTEEVIARVHQLNVQPTTHGIMLSTPTYAHLDTNAIIAQISARKDIDGLGPLNVGLLAANEESHAMIPATALATLHVLERLGSLRGKDAVVIGRGKTVGRPVAALLTHRSATVTLCHSQTAHLELHTRRAQILVVAIGRPAFITPAMVSPGQWVIDCGTNMVDGTTCGDVDPVVAATVEYLSPVPGGVGALTNAFIFSNLVKSATLLQQLTSGDSLE
jgi:methylenetetrahydrofolate dehydrogenase (NADP+) / methenyltetrahydrofolate cyclohydrolase